jgi:hypothetical protein
VVFPDTLVRALCDQFELAALRHHLVNM